MLWTPTKNPHQPTRLVDLRHPFCVTPHVRAAEERLFAKTEVRIRSQLVRVALELSALAFIVPAKLVRLQPWPVRVVILLKGPCAMPQFPWNVLSPTRCRFPRGLSINTKVLPIPSSNCFCLYPSGLIS
jgi:hypothetical protein